MITMHSTNLLMHFFFQKLIFKARSKSNKNCIKDTAKNKKKKTKTDKDVEDPKILDDREKAEKEEDRSGDERMNATDTESARENKTPKEKDGRCGKDRKIDDGIEISIETVEKKDGENATEEETVTLDEEEPKKSGEPLENREVQEVAETVATVKAESKTKEKQNEGIAEAEAMMENGVKTDEIVADSQATATNQSPDEVQE